MPVLSTMNSLEPYKTFILELRGRRVPITIILESLAGDYNLIISESTLKRFLRNNEAASIPSATPPSSPIQPPITPRTRRRAEARNANNVLTESPHRRRRRPIIAPAAPPPAPRLPIRPLPARRHLLARQPLDPLMNVAHSLGPMNVACPHCNALHWKEERTQKSTGANPKFSTCCSEGAVNLPIANDTPESLRILLTDTRVNANGKVVWTDRTAHFQQNIRSYNNAVSFTSLGAKLDRAITNTLNAAGVYTFRIQGALYHSMGSLLPPPGERPRFAQVYMFDSAQEQLQFRSETHPNLQLDILQLLSAVLQEVNPYVQFWQNSAERIAENPQLTIRLTMLNPTIRDPRRYNRPTADEVAAIIVQPENDNEPLDRDIIIQRRNTGELQRISQHSPCYIPMRYPLIFPYGEEGWHPLIPLTGINLPDNANLYAHRRTRRDGIFSPLLHAGRLCQEYCVDAWVCVEANRLNFACIHQAELRADCYNGLQDAIGTGIEEDAHRLGRQIILPSSIPGTPRYMKQLYQDAMAICRHYGRPDFFITFTCNPKWDEIISNIPAGSSAADHPDIVSRVFNLKLKALIDDLLNKHVLGKTVADVYVIEFQKRGLPHAHILLIMDHDDKIRDIEGIDDFIYAEIPDRNIDPDLYNIITSNMMHDPCGPAHSDSPCMNDGKYSKRYPRKFCDETVWNEDGYPVYRRREVIEGQRRKVKCKGVWLDNRWVVPYCPFLSKRYNAHINIEICSSISAFKYLFKYVFKGGDRTTAVLQNDINEIQDYVDARYVSPPEAVWRIFGSKLHHRSPAIQRLQIHLLNEQTVTFNNDTDIVTLLRNERVHKTTLTEFFTANEQAAAKIANGESLDFDCRDLLYQEFPIHMTWDRQHYRWNRRKQRSNTIGRMYFVGPSGGERFYLRMLLTVVKDPTSFEDLRTYNGVVHENFKSACIARGLLDSDEQWDRSLTEAELWQGGSQLRQLFVCILLHCYPTDALQLWINHAQYLSDDCRHRLQTTYQITDPSQEQIHSLALSLIRDLLRQNNSDLDKHDLPAPMHEFASIPLNANRLILDERAYNVDSLRDIVERDYARLNVDQRVAFDALYQAVASGEGGVFFLEGFGGTGKTFLINLVLAKIRSDGDIALSAASSGIAATLLDGGTTAHSRFKIPIDIQSDSTCNIPAQSHLAELIRETKLVFWDEAPMQHRHTFEAVDRTFKDIRNDPRPFGGVVFCFCGDFRQILPVVPRGTRGQIVSACLKRSPLWHHIRRLPLTINMRLFSPQMSPEERLRQEEFANRILAIGEGRDTNNDIIQWPLNGIIPDNTSRSLANAIYPTLTDPNAPLPTAQHLAERAILAARNDTVDNLNEQLLASMNGEVFTSYSADRVVDDGDAETYATEYLNTINLSNLPPHELKLKVGAPVILLRNLSPSTGLCNGTRLRVARINQRVVECEILGGKFAGNMVIIPRIPLSPSSTADLPFEFRRTQFPLRLAFSMTINKAQGQTLNYVGLCLTEPVFTHGQLYVALSRVTDGANLRMIVPDTKEAREEGKIKNVVYSEVFN